jgi:Protein of unknown function (DUF3149)
MKALEILFTSDVGLFSVVTIGIVLAMGAYYVRYFLRHMHEDEAREAAARRG